MRKAVKVMVVAAALSVAEVVFSASLELGSPFTDGMILQRDRAVNVWGVAPAGATVSVAFGGQTVHGTADAGGRWRVKLPSFAASKASRELVVRSGAETVTVKDVLVGEVWVASGQSNMDCPLVGRYTRYRDRQGSLVAQMTYRPYVRFARSTGSWRREPLAKTQSPVVWKTFTPENLQKDGAVSAVAAYYALDLHAALDVPVGLLCAHIGGTNIDAWTPKEGTASRPDLKDVAAWTYYDNSSWPTNFNTYPWKSPTQQPAVLWNGLVAPLAPYSCRGMIWYQGCHNFPDGEWQRYCSKMHALFDGWKLKFENPDFVIRFAQLGTSFSTLCQQQAQFEREEPAAAMAVICDVANKDDIHPNEKATVALRLAAHALRRDYGFTDIQDNSPTVQSVTAEGTNLVVICRDAKSLYVYNDDRSLANNFEIAGADGAWKRATIVHAVPAKKPGGGVNTDGGQIRDPNRIVLCADGIAAPVKVRYWYSTPYRGAVYNEVNLPLGPFEAEIGR